MDESQLKKLLGKYLDGNCTKQEVDQLFFLLEKDNNDNELTKVSFNLWQKIKDEHELTPFKSHGLIYSVVNRSKIKKLHQINFLKIAASIVFLFLVATTLLYFIPNNNIIEYSTGNGQVKEIMLPDRSNVILNANSYLSYSKKWKNREVNLEGEAFFNIKKIPSSNHRNFKVNLEHLSINVIGTQFNVDNRRNESKITLSSGKIKLHIDQYDKEELEMNPGDMVVVNSSSMKPEIRTKRVNPETISSWKESKLIFQNTPLREIAMKLEDIFGFKVKIESDSLKSLEFVGSTPYNNLEVLFHSLEITFDIEVIKKRNEIFIKSKH